jgi:hypothetical protein
LEGEGERRSQGAHFCGKNGGNGEGLWADAGHELSLYGVEQELGVGVVVVADVIAVDVEGWVSIVVIYYL